MSFLVDMPLSPGLAAWLRDQGFKAVDASEIEMSKATDETLLIYAKANEMIVITADLPYPRLLASHKKKVRALSCSGVAITAGNRP